MDDPKLSEKNRGLMANVTVKVRLSKTSVSAR